MSSSKNDVQLQIGKNALRLDLGAEVRVWHIPSSLSEPLQDLQTAIDGAVSAPIGFPPLASAVVPDDRVVITADWDIPQLPFILSGLVQSLRRQPVEISVLLGETAQKAVVQEVREALGPDVEVVLHDPDTREQLGYLAANEHADPIYLNRRLIDADFVLPVILARAASPLDPDPLGGHVFPQFADRQSQVRDRQRLMDPDAAEGETLEAAWLLGFQLMIAVVPANGEAVSKIVAGTTESLREFLVAHHDERSSRAAISKSTPDLVVACVDGDQQQQTWDNVARAVAVAQKVVRPGGTVVVCSALTAAPGPAVRRLRSGVEPERMLTKLQQDLHADALTAAVLLQCRTEGRVLLQTELASELVEDLGFGVVDGIEGLTRLMRQHRNCAIIESAQFSNYCE